MTKLNTIEGIGETYLAQLTAQDVNSVEALLEKGATPQGRKALADATGLSPKLILTWVNHADLFRVKGIGSEYADLLEAAGVDTVPELATRNAANLHQKLETLNTEKKLVRRTPTVQDVEGWVAQAKTLPRVVNY